VISLGEPLLSSIDPSLFSIAQVLLAKINPLNTQWNTTSSK